MRSFREHMKQSSTPYSIRLSEAEEAALTALAARHKCFARGKPSFRALAHQLALGRFELVDKLGPRRAFLNFKKPPGWWRPVDGSMAIEDVRKHCPKWSIEELEATGMEVDGDRISAPWKAWKTPPSPPVPPDPGPPPAWWVDQGERAMRIEDTGMTLKELTRKGLKDLGDGRVAAIWPSWGAK
jgi:hypothetical protein